MKGEVRNKRTSNGRDISVTNQKVTRETNDLVIIGLSIMEQIVECEIHELVTVTESDKEKV